MENRGKEYLKLVENLPIALYGFDIAGNRLIYVNNTMCEYTSYTREELLSMSPSNFFSEQSKPIFMERVSKLVANETLPPKIPYEVITKHGQTI